MNDEGFTLVEFLFVIIILSILVMISFPRLTGIRDKANDTNILNTAVTFRNFMAMYYQDNQQFPSSNGDNEYNYLRENILIEYGELPDISKHIREDEYTVDNASDPKTYELEIKSSNTDKIYKIKPNGINTSEN